MSFDINTALKMADYASRAYHPSKHDFFLQSEKTDASVLIKFKGNNVILAFRGTHNLKDWTMDAQFVKKSIGYGLKIHSGFLIDIDSILPQILDAVSDYYKKDYNYYELFHKISFKITGHSLGGALATLCAFFLEQEGFDVKYCYTFASPRVGNKIFKKVYNNKLGDKTYRVVCAGDLIPHLPPFFNFYYHVGIEIFIQKKILVISPSHLYEFYKDELRGLYYFFDKNFDSIVLLHSIDKDYIKTLKTIK